MGKMTPEQHRTLDLIRAEMRAKRITQGHLAEAIGRDRSVVSRILTGKHMMMTRDLIRIAIRIGLDPGKLIVGVRGETADELAEYNEIDFEAMPEDEQIAFGDEVDEYEMENGKLKFVGRPAAVVSSEGSKGVTSGQIPEIDVTVGAGEGSVGEVVSFPIGENVYSGHPVTAEWGIPHAFALHSLGISAKRAIVLRVVGDSMTPTYLPGDRVIIDLKQTNMTVDAVYMITDGDSPPQIKRLRRVLFSSPAEVEIISDNAHLPSQRVPLDMLKILGRVAGRITPE